MGLLFSHDSLKPLSAHIKTLKVPCGQKWGERETMNKTALNVVPTEVFSSRERERNELPFRNETHSLFHIEERNRIYKATDSCLIFKRIKILN